MQMASAALVGRGCDIACGVVLACDRDRICALRGPRDGLPRGGVRRGGRCFGRDVCDGLGVMAVFA